MSIQFYLYDDQECLHLVTCRNGLTLDRVAVMNEGRAVMLGACPQEFQDKVLAEWLNLPEEGENIPLSEVPHGRLAGVRPGEAFIPAANSAEGNNDDDAPGVSVHQL